MSTNRKTGTVRRAARAIAVTALAVAPLAACNTNSLLQVNDPDVVQSSVFSNPKNLEAVRNGAIREFARAYGGRENTDGGQILYSGLLGDELYASGTYTTRRDIDERRILQTNASNRQAYYWLQRARNHAEQAADAYAADDSAGTADDAYMLNLAGFTYVMFGENYCSGVPFSKLPVKGPADYGAPDSTSQIFERAIMRFDTAMAMAQLANSSEQMNLARVGKARADRLPVQCPVRRIGAGHVERRVGVQQQREALVRGRRRGHQRPALPDRQRPAHAHGGVWHGLQWNRGPLR
jgi:hypothetical protein